MSLVLTINLGYSLGLGDESSLCSGVTLNNNYLDDSSIAYYRGSRSNFMNENWQSGMNYVGTSGGVSDVFAGVRWQMALLIVVLILCFLMLIWFLCWCFGCCRKRTPFSRGYEIYCLIMLCIWFWIWLALFITIIVFIALSQNSGTRARCSFASAYSLPYSGTAGKTWTNSNYLGINNYNTYMNNFKTALPKIYGDGLDVRALSNAPQSLAINNLSSAYNTFSTKYSPEVTLDPLSNQRVNPISILNLRNGAGHFGGEVSDLTYTSNQLSAAARNVASYNSNSVTKSNYDTAANVGLTNSANLANNYRTWANQMIDGSQFVWNRAVIPWWILFAIGCLLLILWPIALIILCMMVYNRACLHQMFCLKIILILITILTIGWGICCCVLLTSSFLTGAYCHAYSLYHTNLTSGTSNVFNNASLDPMLQSYLLQCRGIHTSTDFTNLVGNNNVHYCSYETMADGFSSYDAFLSNYVNDGRSSGIEAQLNNYRLINTGQEVDQPGVNPALWKLSDLTQCSNTYRLSNALCTGSSCSGIYEGAQAVPSCSSDSTKANLYYNNLKTYMSEEKILMPKLINDLSPTGANSLYSSSVEAKKALFALQPTYNSINARAGLPLLNGQTPREGLRSLMNCNRIYNDFIMHEDDTCFEFNYFLWILMVISCVAFLVLFFMLLHLWSLLWDIEGSAVVPIKEQVYGTDYLYEVPKPIVVPVQVQVPYQVPVQVQVPYQVPVVQTYQAPVQTNTPLYSFNENEVAPRY